jgi:hypothetical protein
MYVQLDLTVDIYTLATHYIYVLLIFITLKINYHAVTKVENVCIFRLDVTFTWALQIFQIFVVVNTLVEHV